MYPPVFLQNLKYAVRGVPGFVGHSFRDEDKEIVEQIIDFLTKLGVKCDSGLRAEATGVIEKVKERIHGAELFVGIFTRREKISKDKYTTSAWVIEEKATAIAAGKRLLLFVEEGVSDFGGLQGDYEYIQFNRANFCGALVRAIDYVLSITSVKFESRVEGGNKLSIQISSEKTAGQQLEELRAFCSTNPKNAHARVTLAKVLKSNGDYMAAGGEFQALLAEFPNMSVVHHDYGHYLQDKGDNAAALLSFQHALDLDPTDYKNNRCYGRCLYDQAKSAESPVVRRSTLNKARRLIERAAVIGGEQAKTQIDGDLFIVNEAIQELSDQSNGT